MPGGTPAGLVAGAKHHQSVEAEKGGREGGREWHTPRVTDSPGANRGKGWGAGDRIGADNSQAISDGPPS